MRPPEGCCPQCWQPHPMSQARCYGPPKAEERSYGDQRTDRLETFLLDATRPRQDPARAFGFQIDEAKTLAGFLRAAFHDPTPAGDDRTPDTPPRTDER